ncbi:hypothetical protein BWQ96_04161 [Gracilariopsis chorda]|uniref:Uncharacterized protein n=1 Tax=Gracilariopsis chorda TaxID=448386 RepID=A0A2V3IVB8_9FLOR|nr:hypothetical protein BWQ96_04161 [Gracilariopsis chorda]|eukprot:PXF46061.1 hypothetical protein BWQ96_04161 [Gracilariopsis chorda]
MELNTNLAVPIFNVLKYLFITIAIDGIVRNGLDSFEHFQRRWSLYRGYSVTFQATRIDRYNLLQQISKKHFSLSITLVILTLAAYAVEIGLEFATNSRSTRVPIAGKVTRLNYTENICGLDTIIYPGNIERLINLADKCIIFENEMYRLYRPIWITNPEVPFQPLCEPTPGNLLAESMEVYDSLEGKGEEAALEIEKLRRIMHDHSYKANAEEGRSFFTLSINSTNVIAKSLHQTSSSDVFLYAVFMKPLGDTSVKCYGNVYGRRGSGMMRLMMFACVNGLNQNSTLAYALGTSLVEKDVGEIDKDWSTVIAVENRRSVYRFARGVIDDRLQTNAAAYAAFIADARPQDKIRLNKYAIAYRNCEQLSLPSRNAESWEEHISASSSRPQNVATVELWALILVLAWVIIVTVSRFLVHSAADRMGMPNRIFGEHQIVCLWLKDKQKERRADYDDNSVETYKKGYLSVENGELKDSITATKSPRYVDRDRRKKFSP